MDLKFNGKIELAEIPANCEHNAHMFYIKLKDLEERSELIAHLQMENITSAFHYIPLHSSPSGLSFSRFHGADKYTTTESKRLLRLPLYYDMNPSMIEKVSDSIHSFFKGK